MEESSCKIEADRHPGESGMFNRARQSHNVVNQDPKRSNAKPRRQTTVARDIRRWPRVNRS